MIESNIRIVSQGANLKLAVRRAQPEPQTSSPDLLQKLSKELSKQQSLAAIPDIKTGELLVASPEPISELVVKEENWQARIIDLNEIRLLKFENFYDKTLLTELLERCLIIQIEQSKDFWMFDSPRTFYEPQPFLVDRNIAAYRRFKISSIPIQDVGVGLIVNVSVAFFTTLTIADFFREDLPELEKRCLQKRFEVMSRRQQGQKATLWYDSGRNNSKCFFVEFISGMTCAITGEIRFAGHTYKSLLDYYQEKSPNLSISSDDLVTRVSFPGLDKPQLVAAKQLRLRVMNDTLPQTLKQVDKFPPDLRASLIDNFWTELGEYPLGLDAPKVATSFWQPPPEKIVHLKSPNLIFGQQQVISASAFNDFKGQKSYYRQRSTFLRKFGCLIVPPAMTRTIHIQVPTRLGEEIANRLGDDLTERISSWTRKTIVANVGTYDTLEKAFSNLRREERPGMVVFVFEDDDPADYHRVVYELQKWRVKRITCNTLEDRFAKLQTAQSQSSSDRFKPKGERDWQSFIDMSGLDVLQLLDCTPWGITEDLHYDAQVAIDVGWDYRHFGLSLLISKWQSKKVFQLDTIVQPKSDVGKESINKIALRDEIIALFQRRQRPTPLQKILALRDGRKCGEEPEAIEEAQSKLIELGGLAQKTQIDIVDVYKDSAKEIRLWERQNNGNVEQISEGEAVFIDEKTVVLTTTGAPTLHQGTAEPILLVGRSEGINMLSVVEDFYWPTHLNWSNPNVAQRLTLGLKRIDDDLINRASQEIRRYS